MGMMQTSQVGTCPQTPSKTKKGRYDRCKDRIAQMIGKVLFLAIYICQLLIPTMPLDITKLARIFNPAILIGCIPFNFQQAVDYVLAKFQ